MNIINNYLVESYPPHPEDLVFKKIKEKDIWNYWMGVKKPLLDWIKNRYVNFLLRIDDKLIFKRKINNEFIRLNEKNYETLISGRTNVIYVTIPTQTDYFVVDIDPGSNVSENQVINTEKSCRETLSSLTKKFESLRSSKTGIHINGHMNKKYNVDDLKEIVIKQLHHGATSDIITINKPGRSKRPNLINLDLSSMKTNGVHICKYSLTKDFFISDDISHPLRQLE